MERLKKETKEKLEKIEMIKKSYVEAFKILCKSFFGVNIETELSEEELQELHREVAKRARPWAILQKTVFASLLAIPIVGWIAIAITTLAIDRYINRPGMDHYPFPDDSLPCSWLYLRNQKILEKQGENYFLR